MIGYGVDQAKGLFFDRGAVKNATDRAARRVLSRFGAYVRRRARSSIRKRKKPSQAGKPPSSHVGLLRKLILFGYEPDRQSVVIGPARLNRIGNAPEALEHGGVSTIAAGTRRRPRRRKVTIAARPFMGPALEAEKPKLGPMWADTIK